MTAPADLAEVRAALALVAQATPGPWSARIFTTHVVDSCQQTQWHEVGSQHGTICEAPPSVFEDETAIGASNIRAIVALRNAAPAIAAAVEELEDARAETARQRETIRAGADAVRSANASTTEIGCRLDDAGERIAALERQVCRLVSGQEIDGDRLCQHHGADVAALALLSDERAAHAETLCELDALLTALGAQVTPGGQTLDACEARRVADGMRRAKRAAEVMRRAIELLGVSAPAAPATVARPISEWHEDRGSALWWRFPVEEPPYSGSPLDSDWPGYHTHWTPIVCPDEPQGQADADPASRGPIGGGS